MIFTTTRLLDQIKLKGALAQGRFEDQELLDIAYDSLMHDIVPFLIEKREEYYVVSTTSSITASQSSYPMPRRAIGQTLREVKLIRGTAVHDLKRMDVEEVRTTLSGTPEAFYVENNEVVLYPTPSSTQDTLKMYYYIRPSNLVPTSEGAIITAIDTATNILTITAGPSSWTTSNTFDLVQGTSGFKIIGEDLTASSVSTTSITLTTLPSTLVVGDYINLADETCFPYLPTEAHGLLVFSAVAEILQSIGDMQGLQGAEARVQKLKKGLTTLFATRISGAPKLITYSLL